MLNVPNLDDQRFEETLESAVLQIPYLYPEWTDFNEHDPGITLLELFVWYKQMQQYQLNCLTDRNMEAFFKLLGITPHNVRPARVMAEVLTPGQLPAGTPLISDAGVVFTLEHALEGTPAVVEKLYSKRNDGLFDVTDMVGDGGAAFYAFGAPGSKAYDTLLIGLTMPQGTASVRLWVSVFNDYDVQRNPFDEEAEDPRTLTFSAITAAGETPLTVLCDDTNSFSCSGKLILQAKDAYEYTDAGDKLPKLCWIKCCLTDAGCEEMPQITGIIADYAQAVQRQTLSEVHPFIIATAGKQCVTISTHLALTGTIWAMVRYADGWGLIKASQQAVGGGMQVTVTLPKKAMYDDEANLRICCTDSEYYNALFVSASGVPGERVLIPDIEGHADPANLLVLCGSKNAAQEMRYQDWQYIHGLHRAGCRDCCYTVDDSIDELMFGDGSWGRVVPGGENSIVVAGLSYVMGASGSAVTGTGLFLADTKEQERDMPVCTVTHVQAGADKENVSGMEERMKSLLATQIKAVTAKDYEQIAMRTPGIRIRQARALPLYDPQKKRGQDCRAHVTMVVVPASEERFPRPDARFLAAVQRQMERYRTVCTCIHVIGPEYMGVTVWAELLCSRDEAQLEAEARQALKAYFQTGNGNALGMPLKKTEISTLLAECTGVLGVLQLELRGAGSGAKATEQGDLLLPPNAIAYLNNVELHMTRA